MTERRRHFKVIEQSAFSKLCDFLVSPFIKVSTDTLSKELKDLGIAPVSFDGPHVIREVARIKREREALRREKAKQELLLKLKARKDEENYFGSPMADLGSMGGTGRKTQIAKDSDGEYKFD